MKPIAIIGMASIFPKAANLSQYWENILAELNCIEEVPPSRWSIEDYYDPDPNKPDKSYSKYGGFIPDTVFDPMEFGLPPNILEVTDVSQLLSLIVAKEAFEDAGYGTASGSILDQTGVILGMVGMSSKVIHPLLNRLQYPVWEKVLKSSSVAEEEIPAIIERMKLAYIAWNENAFPGAIGNVVAGRIANRMDLGGMNCIVDAACGSSLAAVNMAVNELETGNANMMLTGGVDTDNSILTYLCFSKTPAFSKGNQLRAFSDDSDGMLSGEGIGMLVLKRLLDAEQDGDRIYAVIRGIGTSSDGHYKSIYAPRASGQAKALRRAYANAEYLPSTVGLIEAHGTGTYAGDPAEFEGLREVFSEQNPNIQHIALGSVKSQIGHTKAAAGAASLIKASLSLFHKTLPATINVTEPHHDFDIKNSPFYINTETRPWFNSPQDGLRRAGVSSFGFGGTNFHVTLEEYQGSRSETQRIHQTPFTILLSAETTDQLIKKCQDSLKALQDNDDIFILNQLNQDANHSELPEKYARVGFIVESVKDAREKFDECLRLFSEKQAETAWSHPKGIFFRSSGMDGKGKIVALFPGQGSQYLNMGKELAINFALFRETFEKADMVVTADGREKISNVVFPIPVFSDDDRKMQQDNLTRTENAQPSIGTISMAYYKLLRDAGFKADFFAGHSFGELTALWAAGVYDDEAFLRLAKARGEAMSLPPSSDQDAGSMIAVKGDVEKVQTILESEKGISIANFNSPSQIVLAGASEAVQAVKPKIEELGLAVYPLQVSAAFHTSFVKHAKGPFEQAVLKEVFQQAAGVVYSNSTALEYEKEPQKISQVLAEHILSPVRFHEEIENIYEGGGSIFIEIGPKNILTNLVKDILKEKPHEAIALNTNPKSSSDAQFRQAVVQMRVLGINLGNTDPYKKNQKKTKTEHNKVSVILNGGLYITEKTRSDFENSLLEKTVSCQTPLQAEMNVSITARDNPAITGAGANFPDGENRYPTNNGGITPISQDQPQMNQTIQVLIEQFQKHQNDLLLSHQQFLQNDHASRKIIQEIVQAELSAISKMNGNPHMPGADQVLSHMEKSAEVINNQHSGTSQAHLAYIQSQTEFSKQYALLIQELLHSEGRDPGQHIVQTDFPQSLPEMEHIVQPVHMSDEVPGAAIIEKPVSSAINQASPHGDIANLTQSFLQIVSEKTGYPTEMLELNMDMEADLGIDSIKRVEILSAMQEQFPQLPVIEAEELAVLRTLDQIISSFSQAPQNQKHIVPEETEFAPSPATGGVTTPDVTQPAKKEVQDVFLEVVSEKTGYPVDMLELGMDMEADLGIDSIKRVEILGAMQEKIPQLPVIEAEELAVLRTLEEIITNFNEKSTTQAAGKLPPEIDRSEETIAVDAAETKRSSVMVKRLPDPDYLEYEIPEDCLILITDDGSDRSRLLVEHLLSQGKKVGLVHFGMLEHGDSGERAENVQHFQINLEDDDEVQAKMEEIISRNEKIAAFIHVNPLGHNSQKGVLEMPAEETSLLKTIFLMARHLRKPLTAAGKTCRPAFLTISCMDGHFGLNDYSLDNPLPGGLAGLTKSLRLEWTDVFCRALDFHPDIDAQTVVQTVLMELHDPDLHTSEVGYTPEGRYTLSLEGQENRYL